MDGLSFQFGCGIPEQGDETDPVEQIILRGVGFRDFQQGGVEVNPDNVLPANRSGLGNAGPFHDHWLAYASLVKHAL